MHSPNKVCRCILVNEASEEASYEVSIEALEAIRSECPALVVLLPDDVWLKFKEWHCKPDLVAWHHSTILLALRSGNLRRITSPIHRYLVNVKHVQNQYKRDLQERWMFDDAPIKRHQKLRMFSGRLAELQCAEWLEEQGWRITGLEAWREGPDIEAHATEESEVMAFEVKFIGREDEEFKTFLRAIGEKGVAIGASSAYTGMDYLLFRVYEAAKQLIRVNRRRIVVVVINSRSWHKSFKVPLENDWINWPNPNFIHENDL